MNLKEAFNVLKEKGESTEVLPNWIKEEIEISDTSTIILYRACNHGGYSPENVIDDIIDQWGEYNIDWED